MLKTTDYSIFKTIKGNRAIYKPHLQRLISSIEKNNMLEQNPVIVNEKYEVIDGQHRLEAARTLSLPVYYTMKDEASLSDIQLLNSNARSWLTHDYLISFVEQGKPEYIALKKFADAFRLSVPISLRILSDNFNSVIIKPFREGNFKVVDMEKAETLAYLVAEVRKHSPDNAWTHTKCVEALSRLATQMNPRLFVDALDKYQQVITRRMSVKDYLREFENILSAGGKNVILK